MWPLPSAGLSSGRSSASVAATHSKNDDARVKSLPLNQTFEGQLAAPFSPARSTAAGNRQFWPRAPFERVNSNLKAPPPSLSLSLASSIGLNFVAPANTINLVCARLRPVYIKAHSPKTLFDSNGKWPVSLPTAATNTPNLVIIFNAPVQWPQRQIPAD